MIQIQFVPPADLESDLLVIFSGLSRRYDVLPGKVIQHRIREIDAHYISNSDARDEILMLGAPFKTRRLLVMNSRVLKYQDEKEKIKSLCAIAYRTAESMGCRRAHVLLNHQEAGDAVVWAMEGLGLGCYRFERYKTIEKSRRLEQLSLVLASSPDSALLDILNRVRVTVAAVNRTRDWVNEPSNVATTSFLADQARLAARQGKLSVEIIEKKGLKSLGCHGHLYVGAGGRTPPFMVILKYRPRRKSKTHVALIGKGICFDTGGVCIKHNDDLWEMKTDMAGAASVLGTMQAVANLNSPHNVTGILCLAENGLDSRAFRPGDIFYAMNGKSIMVDNTDAEGRLVLADGLCMAARYKATHCIDLATLTGACVTALGEKVSGIMGNSEPWIQRIISHGRRYGETYWQLPLVDEYREILDTEHADIKNSGDKTAGAITGALFLREFVEPGVQWAHLDIAGTNWVKKPWRYFCKGATGVGVRPLISLLGESF